MKPCLQNFERLIEESFGSVVKELKRWEGVFQTAMQLMKHCAENRLVIIQLQTYLCSLKLREQLKKTLLCLWGGKELKKLTGETTVHFNWKWELIMRLNTLNEVDEIRNSSEERVGKVVRTGSEQTRRAQQASQIFLKLQIGHRNKIENIWSVSRKGRNSCRPGAGSGSGTGQGQVSVRHKNFQRKISGGSLGKSSFLERHFWISERLSFQQMTLDEMKLYLRTPDDSGGKVHFLVLMAVTKKEPRLHCVPQLCEQQ